MGWGGTVAMAGGSRPPEVLNPAACFFKSKSSSCFSILGVKNGCQTQFGKKMWLLLASEFLPTAFTPWGTRGWL